MAVKFLQNTDVFFIFYLAEIQKNMLQLGKGLQMATQIHSLLVIFVGILVHSTPAASQEIGETTYGSAEIARIRHIESDFTLICDLHNFPPIIGQKIPVRIRGLESLESYPKSELHIFLETLFKQNQNDPNHPIQLRNIQRGKTFCLIADIDIDGRDLGDQLVHEGLVKRILKVPTAEQDTDAPSRLITPQSTETLNVSQSLLRPVSPTPPQSRGFVASKSSKIFHRADCPHAKRIAEEKKVYFPNRDRAIAAGRRPCKFCNP